MNFRCSSYVGRTANLKQSVSLSVPGCMSKGVALHELMHTLGFEHEHSRSDRDEYIKVIGENIKGGKRIKFIVDLLHKF